MSIRLNKAISELNIGLQTAVDFLKKRSELGAAPEGPNSKLTDGQYNALVEAYKSDKEERTQAEMLLKRPKEKKRVDKKEGRVEPRPQQKYTPLGKIDLDSLGKKPSAKSVASTSKPEEKKADAPAVSKPQEVKKEAPKPVAKPAAEQKQPSKEQPKQPAVEPKAQPAAAPKATEPKTEPAATTQQQSAAEASTEPKVFTLKSERKSPLKVNVLGKIDLDSLNQTTRPKKKTKEERRKEREEKAQHGGAGTAGGERKKRQRINKERIDIAAAAKQNNAQGGQKNAGGSNKKKNRKRGGQKPAEVSEEDVARQVKETLARLTSKGQNKKGAKYRKEKRDAVQEHLKEQR